MSDMLNKENLMIGDWVRITDFPLIGMVKQITPEHFVRSHCKFEGIKLTNDVFEKNGFTEDGNSWHFGTVPNRLTVEYISSGFYGVSYHGGDTFTTIQYVHELQRVMKVCKIKFDIKL